MINLVIIDDAKIAHTAVSQWARATPETWFTLHEYAELVYPKTRSGKEAIAVYNATIASLLLLRGPTIVILDLCLFTKDDDVDKFRDQLKQRHALPIDVPEDQVEGLGIGVDLVKTNAPDPLLIVVATTLGDVSNPCRLLQCVATRPHFKVSLCASVMDGASSLMAPCGSDERYENLLRRGLEISRLEKGNDSEMPPG